MVKKPAFLAKASWVKRVADLPRREKVVYLHRLPDRLAKIKEFLDYIRVFSSVEACSIFVGRINPALVIVDPKLMRYIDHPRKIPEDRVKRRHERILALLADNVAYYAYWVARSGKNPRLLSRLLK